MLTEESRGNISRMKVKLSESPRGNRFSNGIILSLLVGNKEALHFIYISSIRSKGCVRKRFFIAIWHSLGIIRCFMWLRSVFSSEFHSYFYFHFMDHFLCLIFALREKDRVTHKKEFRNGNKSHCYISQDNFVAFVLLRVSRSSSPVYSHFDIAITGRGSYGVPSRSTNNQKW